MVARRKHLARGVAEGDVAASPSRIDAIARYYTTVVEGLSVQTCDGASRADLEAVIACAMATWEPSNQRDYDDGLGVTGAGGGRPISRPSTSKCRSRDDDFGLKSRDA